MQGIQVLGIAAVAAIATLAPVRTVSAGEFPAGATTRQKLEKVANEAEVGNGDTSVKRYNVRGFDVEEAVKELNKLRFEGCTWTVHHYRRENIAALKEFTKGAEAKTVDQLQELYDEKVIKSIIGLESDGDISCSRFYLEVRTRDGYQLDLNYDYSD